MKKALSVVIIGILCFTACKKSDSNPNSSTTFTATVDGKATTFTINSATLLRSTGDNEKRLDITGTSTDNSKRVTLTLGIETSLGSGMTVKSYVLNPFPEDDPNTPNVDEAATTQGYTTYSTTLGSGNWFTDVYDEQGSFNLSSCDSAHSMVSGTFQTTLTDNYASPAVVVTIKDGKMNNVKYTVLN